jgi:hypothetical protein
MNADPISAPANAENVAAVPDAAATDAMPKGYTPGNTAADAVTSASANTISADAALFSQTVKLLPNELFFDSRSIAVFSPDPLFVLSFILTSEYVIHEYPPAR